MSHITVSQTDILVYDLNQTSLSKDERMVKQPLMVVIDLLCLLVFAFLQLPGVDGGPLRTCLTCRMLNRRYVVPEVCQLVCQLRMYQ